MRNRSLFPLLLVLTLGCPEIVVPPEQDVGSNGAPAFAEVGPQEAVEGVLFRLEVSATDPEGDVLTLSVASPPDGSTLEDGVFQWTPGQGVSEPGADARLTLTFAARDATGAEGTLEVSLTVLNNSDDDALPDATDDDDDGDGLADPEETATNPLKADTDDDTVGDKTDNCPTDGNTDQLDTDGDKVGDACDPDDDADTVLDVSDNCPTVKNPGNPDQADLDGDGKGDACDDDRDGDEVVDSADNCPTTANQAVAGKQADQNQDGLGDACDPDDDGDGVDDEVPDNCRLDHNPDQADNDKDLLGDVCDPDDDNDGEDDASDNCALVFQASQVDTDEDGVGDACDVCVDDVTNVDADTDGVCDSIDNCLGLSSTDLTDTDKDGEGDACDLDDDEDDVLDASDNCQLVANPLQESCDVDLLGNACDDDDDDDLRFDVDDNCVCVANSDQADCDGDDLGDACEDDDDNDGVPDSQDNCPGCAPNSDQEDTDHDDLGDVCDPDDDNDDKQDNDDNCPLVANPDQAASDDDLLGDACDEDDDDDGLADTDDNCRTVENPGQANLDGDPEGDACDEDDDDDQVLDGADTCPTLFSPHQSDLDLDGIGDVCDHDIELPPGLSTGAILGAAGGGVTALVLSDAAGCSSCLPASFVVVDAADFSVSDAHFASSATAVTTPYVSGDRAAYVGALTTSGGVVARRVVEGGAADAFGSGVLTTVLPTWLAAGDASFGVTQEASSQKLYALEAGKAAVLTKSAAAFVDSNGAGHVVGRDGTHYLPFQSAAKYGVVALLADTGKAVEPLTAPLPLTTLSGLAFLAMDTDSGNPWWCQRRVGAPEVVRLDGAVPGPAAAVSGVTACSEMTAQSTPGGRLWIAMLGTSPQLGTVASGEAVASRPMCAPAIIRAGARVVAVGDCGAEVAEVVDTDGLGTPALWTTTTVPAYGRVTAANQRSEAVAVAWRTNKSGASGVEALLRGPVDAQLRLTGVDSATKPVIQGLWVTRKGQVLSHLLGTFGPNQTVLTLGGELGGLELVATKGYASVVESVVATYVLHNGSSGAGLYHFDGSNLQLLTAAVVDGLTNRPEFLGVSGGSAVFALRNTGSFWRLIAVNETSLHVTTLVDELLGPPTQVLGDAPGPLSLRLEAASGVQLVRLVDGVAEVLAEGQLAARFVLGPGGDAWGTLALKSGAWSLCRIKSAACTTLPTGGPLPFTAVDDGGLFHAAWICDDLSCGTQPGSPRVHLYRSFNLAP